MTENRAFTNTERFIHEVSSRSCIWNKNCPEYKIKKKRKQAWEEICGVFFENYKTKNKDRQEHLCLLLQKKWKSLRDAYVREVRKNNQLKYAHSMSLSFLDHTIPKAIEQRTQENQRNGMNTVILNHDAPEENENGIGNEDYDDDDDEHNDNEEQEEMMFKKKQSYFYPEDQSSINDNNSMYLDIESLDDYKLYEQQEATLAGTKGGMNGCVAGGIDDDDEDRMFLLSLLKDLKKVPQQNKLEAKSELLLVLNKWQKTY